MGPRPDRAQEPGLGGRSPACGPGLGTAYEPGETGQCDLWFTMADIPLEFGPVGRPPVLVMVAGYSEWIAARMRPSQA